MPLPEVFDRWAPEGSPWSAWAKPVLFASFAARTVSAAQPPPAPAADLAWLDALPSGAALVIDLPGETSVLVGLALAERGYQPVPLFNATSGPRPAVDVEPIVRALVTGAAHPALLRIAPDARPAFLLDAQRMAPSRSPRPGDFDNRWMVFPQDFPSASFLLAHGVTCIVLVNLSGRPSDDLSHVLLRWQDAGLPIHHVEPSTSAPSLINVHRPRSDRALWYRALVLLGLRRHGAGGFGAIVPEPSSSHGFA